MWFVLWVEAEGTNSQRKVCPQGKKRARPRLQGNWSSKEEDFRHRNSRVRSTEDTSQDVLLGKDGGPRAGGVEEGAGGGRVAAAGTGKTWGGKQQAC